MPTVFDRPQFPTAAGPASAKRPPGIFVLPLGIIMLLAGLWGGLARLGYQLPAVTTVSAQHGVLMSLSFLGTLISIERAVALARFWAWGVPLLSVAGSIWLIAGGLSAVGYGVLSAAGVLLVIVYGRLDRIQRSTHNTLMGLAAAGWAVGAGLGAGGLPVYTIVPWLAVFLVVTITAERLELSRMLKRSMPVRVTLVVAILAMVTGSTVTIWQVDIGMRITGVAMVAMALWLSIYDLARRTIYANGVTRFMAAGLLAGYAWLAAGGVLWAVAGFRPASSMYDAQLHTIFLGFVMSMVFAHAPVIAPAVIRRPLPYFPIFYAPLALLHAALLLRVVVGDAAGIFWAWQVGGVLNEVALLAFVAVTVGAFVRAAVNDRRRGATRPGEPATGVPATGVRASSGKGTVIGGALVGLAVVAAAVIFANSGSATASGSQPGAQSEAPSGDSVDVISAAEAAAGIDVSLVDMRIVPSHLTVEPGAHLVLNVTNNGGMHHDLYLATGQGTPLLAPGESAVLDAGVISADVEGWCTVPGHRAAGMTMSITAADSGSTTTSSAEDAVSQDLSATPPPGWEAIAPSLEPAPDTTVHRVTWRISDVKTAVAPDVTQTLWTFDGRVPGPVLRGKVGDRFNVTLVNDTDMEHNIDFHAEYGPPAKVMKPVAPGESRTYSFVATHAGAWLYHCSIMPMLMHLGNGMYGALIIDPPDLKPVDEEYLLVGSELFFGPEGGVGDYAKMLADDPDTVVFNGYPFAYRKDPLTAEVGDSVRIWVVNAGPTRPINFHVIGAPFTTEYLDGAYLLKDGRSAGGESGAAQVLAVAAGSGGFVELTFTQTGRYPFMTHRMADAVLGAAGEFMVTD